MKLPFTTVILTLVFLCAMATRPPRVCRTRTTIPHEAIILPFSEPTLTKVPLIIAFPCRIRHAPKRAPLVVLLQGALLRPQDYTRFCNILARRGFIVALPDYTQRRFITLASSVPQFGFIKRHIRATLRAGFICPRSPQITTVQLIVSVLRYFTRAPPKSGLVGVRNRADLSGVILFGHSQGGAAAGAFFNPTCVPFANPVNKPIDEILADPMIAPQLTLRLLCEQYTPFTSQKVRVAGIVSFEGVNQESGIVVPEGVFHVVIHSLFGDERYGAFFEEASVKGRLALVRISDSNHYGPNDFERANDNQTPVCALPRQPPEDLFSTTKERQERVIRSVAKVVTSSHNVFVRGRSVERLTALTGKENLNVQNVTLFYNSEWAAFGSNPHGPRTLTSPG